MNDTQNLYNVIKPSPPANNKIVANQIINNIIVKNNLYYVNLII